MLTRRLNTTNARDRGNVLAGPFLNRPIGTQKELKYLNKIDKYIVFGVVRNPYDRIMSAYNMFVISSWDGVINSTYIYFMALYKGVCI